MTAPAVPPAIILVRPQLGANIGACARAMRNFALTDLRLVAPRDGWPNPDAGPSASGADIVLADARVYPDLAAAIADLGYVYATTVRGRELTKPVVTPAAAAVEIRARGGTSGIVFGPERSGLETGDLVYAQAILTVPVNPAFGSLNLAQAVLLCAHHWFAAAATVPDAAMANYAGPASQHDLDGLIRATEAALEPTGYFAVPGRAEAKRLSLRNLFTRPAYSENEVRTLRGIITALTRRS